MESGTTAARFMNRGLGTDADKTVLCPQTPTGDYLDPIGIGANTASWCLSDAPFPSSTPLERPYGEQSCEPSGDYFFFSRSPFSGLQSPGIGAHWSAANAFTFQVPLPTPPDMMISESRAWTGEAGSDTTKSVGVLNGQESSSSSVTEADSPIHTKRSSSEESAPSFTLPSKVSKSATTKPRSRTAKHNIQLRTASRKLPKAGPSSLSPTSPVDSNDNQSPSEPDDDLTPEERRARRNHNRVEKQYRNRLNNQFERLLAVLPLDQYKGSPVVHDGNEGPTDEKRMSKAEVLDMATRRIKALEVDRERLQKEREELMRNIDVMARAVQAARQKA